MYRRGSKDDNGCVPSNPPNTAALGEHQIILWRLLPERSGDSSENPPRGGYFKHRYGITAYQRRYKLMRPYLESPHFRSGVILTAPLDNLHQAKSMPAKTPRRGDER